MPMYCRPSSRAATAVVPLPMNGSRTTCAVLANLPDVANAAGLGSEPESRFGDEIDDLVGGEEVSRVVIESAGTLPDDDLANGEPVDDVGTVLQQSLLHSPLVVVEDGAIG